MSQTLIFVDGFAPAPTHREDVSEEVWGYAMDQRAFGPRKLWVVFADSDGTFRGLAYTDRTRHWRQGFQACLDYLGAGATAAIVLNDEPVTAQEQRAALLLRLAEAQAVAQPFGIHLVDWIACDDEQFCAARLRTLTPADQPDWWDVPAH